MTCQLLCSIMHLLIGRTNIYRKSHEKVWNNLLSTAVSWLCHPFPYLNYSFWYQCRYSIHSPALNWPVSLAAVCFWIPNICLFFHKHSDAFFSLSLWYSCNVIHLIPQANKFLLKKTQIDNTQISNITSFCAGRAYREPSRKTASSPLLWGVLSQHLPVSCYQRCGWLMREGVNSALQKLECGWDYCGLKGHSLVGWLYRVRGAEHFGLA